MADVLNFNRKAMGIIPVAGAQPGRPNTGYRIPTIDVIEKYYEKRHPYGADFYYFVLLSEDGSTTELFHGFLQGQDDMEDLKTFAQTTGKQLTEALTAFANSGIVAKAKYCPYCPIQQAADDKHTYFVACQCDRGTIVGGWHNSSGNGNIAKLMLAFCVFTLAAINNVCGRKDELLYRKAYCTIPDDCYFGNFQKEEAINVWVKAYTN